MHPLRFPLRHPLKSAQKGFTDRILARIRSLGFKLIHPSQSNSTAQTPPHPRGHPAATPRQTRLLLCQTCSWLQPDWPQGPRCTHPACGCPGHSLHRLNPHRRPRCPAGLW